MKPLPMERTDRDISHIPKRSEIDFPFTLRRCMMYSLSKRLTGIRILFILTFLLSGIGVGRAQEEVLGGRFFGVGARAMGMGGAFMAVADDYTALYWNPAGLAQIHRLELFGSLSHDRFENDATYLGFGMSESQSKTRLNALGFTYPVPTERGSLVLSAGYNRINSFDGVLTLAAHRGATEYVDAWETESGGLGSWSFGGAIDVSPSLSFGAALDIWTGKDTYTWDYLVTNSHNPIYDYRYLDTIESEYSGVGLKFGGLLRANKQIKLGFTVTTPVTFTIDEYWTQQTDTLSFSYYADGQFEYEVRTPYRFGFGGALSLRHLRLAADVEYVDWTQTEYKSPYWMVADNWVFTDTYRDVYTYRMGAEYDIPKSDVTLRAGYMNDPLPYTNPQIHKDREYLTAGVGFIVDHMVKIDLAVVHGLWEKSADDLRENIQSDRVMMSMAYRF